jgi:hypothetical protein
VESARVTGLALIIIIAVFLFVAYAPQPLVQIATTAFWMLCGLSFLIGVGGAIVTHL